MKKNLFSFALKELGKVKQLVLHTYSGQASKQDTCACLLSYADSIGPWPKIRVCFLGLDFSLLQSELFSELLLFIT